MTLMKIFLKNIIIKKVNYQKYLIIEKKNNFENLPLADKENYKEKENRSFESSNSPKIMKITKKRINDLSSQIIMNSQQKILMADSNSKVDSISIKPNSKQERFKSMPVYEHV